MTFSEQQLQGGSANRLIDHQGGQDVTVDVQNKINETVDLLKTAHGSLEKRVAQLEATVAELAKAKAAEYHGQ
jgi:hypothetical protein